MTIFFKNQRIMKHFYQTKGFFPSLLLAILLIGCEQQTKAPSEVVVSGIIAQDAHWKQNTVYILDQQVTVPSGVSLSIDAGTIIKANPGEASTTSMLVIAKGAKIIAKGTAEEPIIFTSINDDVDLKEGKESSLSIADTGLWGGIIIMGDAPISLQNGDDETFYTGLDPNSKESYYGGENPEDNSGVLEYVSIRHGGIFIGTGSESNGLTLCGVGNKTIINQVEIYANQDDGLEIFGGTVNVSNLFVHACGDDGIDLDEGYTGTIDHFIVELTETSESGIEISSGKGEFVGNFKLDNGLIDLHHATNKDAFTTDETAVGSISNVTISKGENNETIQSDAAEVSITNDNTVEVDKSTFGWTKAKA